LLGQTHVTLTVCASEPNAQLFVRLCDVAPNKESTLVAWGALNLTHRESHTHPEPLQPGRPYQVTVELSGAAWRFRAGHQVRLLLSTHDWPRTWPAPRPFDLEIHQDPQQPCSLHLPLAPPARVQPALDPPAARLPDEKKVNATVVPFQWEIIQERPAGILRFVLATSETLELVEGSVAEHMARRVEIRVPEDDPAGTELRADGTTTIQWPEVTATVTAALHITCTSAIFQFKMDVTVMADGETFSHRQWHETIPRQWL
jgi:hypothetical protein